MAAKTAELSVVLAQFDAINSSYFSSTVADDDTTAPSLSPEFVAEAERMPPVLRHLLVDNGNPAEVAVGELISVFRGSATLDPKDHCRLQECSVTEGGVLQVQASLSPAACASLREAVDRERQLKEDEVDGLPEHQLNLSPQELEQLIGRREARRLWRLPAAYRRWQCNGEGDRADAERVQHETRASAADLEDTSGTDLDAFGALGVADDEGLCDIPVLMEMFIRRYSLGTRPWFPFHPDAHELTINVELSPTGSYSGGALLGAFGGEVQIIRRAEGDATIHNSKLLHAVTRMVQGTRYTLIAFFRIGRGRGGPLKARAR